MTRMSVSWILRRRRDRMSLMRGGDAGGRGDRHAGALGAGVTDELVEHVRLARTGSAGEEHVRAGVQDRHRLRLQHAVPVYSPSGLPLRS